MPPSRRFVWTAVAALCFGGSVEAAEKACARSAAARLVELATAGDLTWAKDAGLKGRTVIDVLVGVRGTQGYPADAKVTGPSGNFRLDRAALYAVRYSTFAPATCDGKAVPGSVAVTVSLP